MSFFDDDIKPSMIIEPGRVDWSPDYKTERDMGLPNHAQLYRELIEIGAKEDSVLSAAQELRMLRPGQVFKASVAEDGTLTWTIDDVTEDPA